MQKYSLLLVLLLGAIVVAAGTAEFLKEANLLTFSLNAFGPIIVVLVGLWIMVCAVECRTGCVSGTGKS